jgi:hypothetical protein
MPSTPNALRWNGGPGHYEVYYVTLTDPGTGAGFWIRYTMVAPLAQTGAQSGAALWFLAVDPRPPGGGRFGRKASCPIDGRDFRSTSPRRVLSNRSRFSPDGWRFEVVDGSRRLVGEVEAERGSLAGVTYHDPDGELAHCYNSETCSMRLHLYERSRAVRGWVHRSTLEAPGRAHFEYAQRTPLPDLELLTR